MEILGSTPLFAISYHFIRHHGYLTLLLHLPVGDIIKRLTQPPQAIDISSLFNDYSTSVSLLQLGTKQPSRNLRKRKKQAQLCTTFTMAPGLVDPPQAAPASNFAKDSVGPKEAFIGGPQVFNKIAEEQGTEKQPPATHPKYLPIWDADTKYLPARHHHRF